LRRRPAAPPITNTALEVLMNLYDKIMKWLTDFGTIIGIFALTAVMVIIVGNVIWRSFGKVIPGTYDLVETITVLVAAFAILNCEYLKRYTTVDMLTTLMKKKTQIWLEQLCHLISFGYWVLICYATAVVTIDKAKIGEHTDLLKMSIIPFRAIWSVALGVIALIVIYNIYRNFRELRGIKP
jgi:TRAP-type C4-dicarboxylate transport system permease small subunit